MGREREFESPTFRATICNEKAITNNIDKLLQDQASSLLPYFCQTQSADLDLFKQICTVWSALPKHIKATIQMLINSCVPD